MKFKFFFKKCPNCSTPLSLRARSKLLILSTTIMCQKCNTVLTLKNYIKFINLTIAIIVTLTTLGYLNYEVSYFIKGCISVFIVFPIISFFSFDYKESEYLD